MAAPFKPTYVPEVPPQTIPSGGESDILLRYMTREFSKLSRVQNNSSAAFPFITPRMFGAKGDGVHNDLSAVNAAISAASTKGLPLYITAGTYEIGSALLTIPSNMTIFGDGDLSVLQMSVNAQSPVFYLNNVSNVSIRNLKISYIAGATSLGYAQAGVLLRNGCQNIVLEGLTITLINRGLNILNSRNVRVSSVYTIGCGDAGLRLVSDHAAGATLHAENALLSSSEAAATIIEDIEVHDCIFDGAATQGSSTPSGFYGFNLQSVSSAAGDNMTNCSFSDIVCCNTTTQGMAIAGTANGISFDSIVVRSTATGGSVGFLSIETGIDAPINLTFTNCVSVGYSYGFFNQTAGFASYVGCIANGASIHGYFFNLNTNFVTMSNCIANSCLFDGWNTVGLSNSSLVGCLSIGNGQNGFTLDGTGSNTTLTSCRATGNPGANFSIGAGAAIVRVPLSVATSFFVATNGNDANEGLTSGTPFLTLAHAMATITQRYDFNGQTVTLQANAGHANFTTNLSVTPWVGGGSFVFDCGGGSITYAGVAATDGAINVQGGALPGPFTFQNGTFSSSTGVSTLFCSTLLVQSASTVIVGTGVTFGAAGFAQIMTNNGGSVIQLTHSFSVSGSAPYLIFGNTGVIANFFATVSITFTGAVTYSGAVVESATGALVIPGQHLSWVNPGNVTGKRYSADSNGIINSQGQGINFIPGTVAGTTSSGGQYQ